MSKGHATLCVAGDLWPDLGSPVTCEEWAKAILLPDDYEIEGVEHDEERYDKRFRLMIASERIPISEYEMGMYIHHRMDNGVASFDHIILARWNRNHWEEVPLEQST